MTAKTVDKSQAISVIYAFFNYLNDWMSKPGKPVLSETETYLAKNFTIVSSGKKVASSAEEYQKRMETFKNKYASAEMSEPLEEPIVSGNQIILHYRVDLTTHTDETKQVYIMALGTIENGKVSRWIQVANENGASSWDK